MAEAHTIAQRQLTIDTAAAALRKPSAGPTFSPAELILIALMGTPWEDPRIGAGRLFDGWDADDNPAVRAVMKCLEDGGYVIRPATREDRDHG